MPHVVARIAAYKRAMASVLHTGAAQSHNAKPSASLQLEMTFGSPVLFSGVASLVLNQKEMDALAMSHKHMLAKLQKLPTNTPDCVIYFLGGTLPAIAILHLRMLSLLGMISRSDKSSILQQIGRGALLASPSNKKSWFINLRNICFKYNLMDPLLVLQDPPSKLSWKKMCKSAVVSYWETELRRRADMLPSLKYFKPAFMSLAETHPIWKTPENDHEVKKASIVCLMLSGRYPTDYHARHWSRVNPSGVCQLCLAAHHAKEINTEVQVPIGSLEHLLLECPSLQATRDSCKKMWYVYTENMPYIRQIIFGASTYMESKNGNAPGPHILPRNY